MNVSPFLRHLLAAVVVIGLALTAYAYRNVIIWTIGNVRLPHASKVQQGILQQDLGSEDVNVVASGLSVPWAMAFLPDGGMLVTERRGTLRHIRPDGAITTIEIEGVRAVEEAGLLGLAVHPAFTENGWLYLYFTYVGEQGAFKNRVDRYRLENDALLERTTIVQNIPGAIWGNGGALLFAPDRTLFISTGDADDTSTPQDLRSLGGKILRVKDDGSIPSDNPFGTAVWSYGHRNVEGLTWDSESRLWATERGRGASAGEAEINLIVSGKNYGWPTVTGDMRENGVTASVVHSGRQEVWSPAGAAWYAGNLLFGSLRGEGLYQAAVNANPVVVKAHFETEFGRIRAVAVGPDKMVYLTTSNTDGRGMPKEGDDRLIRVNPRLFH